MLVILTIEAWFRRFVLSTPKCVVNCERCRELLNHLKSDHNHQPHAEASPIAHGQPHTETEQQLALTQDVAISQHENDSNGKKTQKKLILEVEKNIKNIKKYFSFLKK